MKIEPNAILFQCLECGQLSAFPKSRQDGNKCLCGGILKPINEVYIGINLAHEAISSIKAFSPTPNDTLLIETDAVYRQTIRVELESDLSKDLGCKVTILDRGMKAAAVLNAHEVE